MSAEVEARVKEHLGVKADGPGAGPGGDEDTPPSEE